MASSPLTEMRRICLALPETTETPTWGEPHFRVRGKIFAGCGNHGGVLTIGFKLEREHADQAIRDPRFARAPYVGQHGWISMDAKGVRDWDEVRALVLESYRLIAPKALWAEVQDGKAAAKPKPARRKSSARSETSRPRKSSAASRTRKRSSATRR
ncbi:MAG TPA: MmcQ/YjbR family DNA-binding protein [Myxococcaceae bacterium]|jgi:predicted DNA-binding protein (MmcQ/YjbR family)